MWCDCFALDPKSIAVTAMVSLSKEKHCHLHIDCCHTIQRVSCSVTEPTRANHFLQTNDNEETTSSFRHQYTKMLGNNNQAHLSTTSTSASH